MTQLDKHAAAFGLFHFGIGLQVDRQIESLPAKVEPEPEVVEQAGDPTGSRGDDDAVERRVAEHDGRRLRLDNVGEM